jgi:uncharacterized membrane protein YdfJ with MMPL/SSD domain
MLSRGIIRRPDNACIASRVSDATAYEHAQIAVAALLALSAPALGIADAGSDPTATTSRAAYDLLAEGFGPGFNAPLIVVVQGNAPAALRSTLAAAPGVAAATPPIPSRDGSVSTAIVFPDSKPQDARTQDLVSRLRTEVLPLLARDTGATFPVGARPRPRWTSRRRSPTGWPSVWRSWSDCPRRCSW